MAEEDALCSQAFVAHKMALIQDLLSENSLRHVSTDSNPADLVSRVGSLLLQI